MEVTFIIPIMQLQCLSQEPEPLAATACPAQTGPRSPTLQDTEALMFENLMHYTSNDTQRLSAKDTDKIWEEKMHAFELKNEKVARQISLQWQREKKSLEKVCSIATIPHPIVSSHINTTDH